MQHDSSPGALFKCEFKHEGCPEEFQPTRPNATLLIPPLRQGPGAPSVLFLQQQELPGALGKGWR